MIRRLSLCLLVVLNLALPALAQEAEGPSYDRIYLLGGEGDYLYWSVDPTDPELGQPAITRLCGQPRPGGVPGHSKPCLLGINLPSPSNVAPPSFSHNLFFHPGSVLDGPATWSSAAPLRFRLALDVDTGGVPYTVHLVLQKGVSQSVSPPATQTAPGVWEGALSTGSPLDPERTTLFGVRVVTQVSLASLRIRAAGETYVSFPEALDAMSVPDLVAGDTYAPSRTSFTSATQAFRFNDGQWTVSSFAGELGPTQRFTMDLERDARTLFAWVEVFGNPAVQDVVRDQTLDRRKLEQGGSVTISRDGEIIEHSGSGSGVAGIGIEQMAVVDVPAGPLEVSVDAASEEAEDRMPFKVYVLATHGDRTLDSFRARFQNPRSSRSPAAGLCPAPSVSVPTTEEVRSFRMDLDWDTEAVGMPGWTLRYELPGVGEFPCGEAGTGDAVRVTVPATDVWRVGSTPSHDRTFVSVADTVFDLQVEYVYTPPPPPEEGTGGTG